MRALILARRRHCKGARRGEEDQALDREEARETGVFQALRKFAQLGNRLFL